MNEKLYDKGGLNSTALKAAACVSMLIDHVGYAILWPIYNNACMVDGVYMMGESRSSEVMTLYVLYQIMRGIGRIAFPVFAFLLAEGFTHTHSKKKYAERMLLFALLSEIPYDLAMGGKMIDLERQNVMWTLLAGLLCLWGIEFVSRYLKKRRLFLAAVVTLCAMLVTILLRADWGGTGILFVVLFYRFSRKERAFWVSMVILLIGMAVFGTLAELAVLAGILITLFYNGKLGRANKYIFYLFYPLHLLLIAAVAWGLRLAP